jgi:hypothetical protein
MIHHVAYYQLKPGVDDAVLEELIRSSRSLLLKIPEVLSVRSGRNLDADSQWRFFIAIEVNSLDKLRITRDDSFFIKLVEKHLKPNTVGCFELDFELDPSKDIKYS